MRNPTIYLKMRVLGAIDMAESKTIRDRIKAVSQMTFTDEEGEEQLPPRGLRERLLAKLRFWR